MKRLITDKLVAWSNSERRKPLVLRGARQTGKTYSVLDFARNHLQGKIHVLDFEKRPDLNSLFEKNLQTKRILTELELFLNSEIDIERDLLFFDEVQNSPRALMSLRYFYENIPQLRLIAAGSLLEFTLSEISFPVGRVTFMTMHPMNFIEFLYAADKSLLAEKLRTGEFVFSETIHNLLLDELKRYFFIGGMPEAVSEYIRTEKLRSAFEVHRDLITSFEKDFAKYGKRIDPLALENVLRGSALLVGKQTKYSKITNYATPPTVKKAFELLCRAELLRKVPSISRIGFPLGASVSEKKFKTLFLDIGLLQTLSGLPVDFEYGKNDLLEIFNGVLAEQFVGQELLSRGCDLYYWARDKKGSSAEIDYVTVIDNRIVPVEVKSGSAGKLKSLHLLLKTYPEVETAYVLRQSEYSELPEQKIKFIPLYAAYKFI